MILKKNAKPRRKKYELIRCKQEKEVEEQHIKHLYDIEAKLAGKRIKIEDALTAVTENENMVKFMQEKGIINEKGQINS